MTRVFPILMALLLLVSCSDNATVSDGTATGRLVVEVFDSPPPVDLQSLNLTITEVRVHHTGSGWLTVVEPDTTLDFLQLINGVTAVLADVELPVGKYTQMRLVVADTNEIIVGGENYPLVVPSGVETGVKLNLGFTLEEDQIIEIFVDFDASKAVTWNPGLYRLHPVFRAFVEVVSVKVTGSVTDELGVGIENAMVEAVSSEDSSSTLTDALGLYTLVLREGVYDISASAIGYTSADTTYTEVVIDPEQDSELTGYDFVLQ